MNLYQYLYGYGAMNRVNDATPGGFASGAGSYAYTGLVGREIVLSATKAKRLTDTTVTDYSSTTWLMQGAYQYVKLKGTLTITPARGLVVYWDTGATQGSDDTAYQVTTDDPGGTSLIAGVLINAPTAGNYCLIQTAGVVYAKGKASSLTKSGAIGDAMYVVAAAGTVDNLADVTGLTSVELRKYVGTAWEAPAAGSLKRIVLKNIARYPCAP